MTPFPARLPRPRCSVAALVALVGGVAIAVELMVPVPRPAAKLSSIVACPPRLAGDVVRIGCRATIVVVEIDRAIDPAFSRPPAAMSPRGAATSPRIDSLCGGWDSRLPPR